jgi:hypothetical protein
MKGDVRELYRNCKETKPDIVQEESIVGLPEPVQRHLRYAGIVGKERVNTVRLRQTGYIRQKREQKWMRFIATQYYTVNPPAFLWSGRVKFGPLTTLTIKDKYYQGKGNMKVKLFSFFKVVDADGPEIDQGTMLRYLNEAMWFPSVYLEDYVKWEALDSSTAKATMSYQGVTASAILYFGEQGEITNFVAERYMTIDGEYQLETWSTPITGYGEIRGVRIPMKGCGVWSLSDGEFEYIKLSIDDIEYNQK